MIFIYLQALLDEVIIAKEYLYLPCSFSAHLPKFYQASCTYKHPNNQRWGDLIAIADHFRSDHDHEVNVAHIFKKK